MVKKGVNSVRSLKGKKSLLFFVIALVILIIIIFAAYFLFFRTTNCLDKTCFENAIVGCKKVSWTRQDSSAAWTYTILGSKDQASCEINVKLLRLNNGTIDAEGLQGEEMICNFVKGDTQYPEKDISTCHGLLKEDIQDLLIQRMHNYLLQNALQISQGFNSI